MAKWWRGAALLLAAALLAGCVSSPRSLQACYASARNHDWREAAESLEHSSLAGNGRNRLLYLMEAGLLQRLEGEPAASNRLLAEADLLDEEHYTRSLTAEGLSLVANDTLLRYAAEEYESAFINFYLALNYLELGRPDEAAVEARRLDEKLTVAADRPGGRDNGFLRLFSGLLFAAVGDGQNALVAWRRSLEAYRAEGEVPMALWELLLPAAERWAPVEETERYREEVSLAEVDPGAGTALVAVLVESGFAPAKREAFILVPTAEGVPVKVSVPTYPQPPCLAPAVTAALDGGEERPAGLVSDVDALARRALERRLALTMAKAAARAAAKQLLAHQMEKEYGPLAGLLAQLAALFSEQADLRSWRTLPASIQLALLPAEPGWHTVTLRANGGESQHAVRAEADSVGFVVVRLP